MALKLTMELSTVAQRALDSSLDTEPVDAISTASKEIAFAISSCSAEAALTNSSSLMSGLSTVALVISFASLASFAVSA